MEETTNSHLNMQSPPKPLPHEVLELIFGARSSYGNPILSKG